MNVTHRGFFMKILKTQGVFTFCGRSPGLYLILKSAFPSGEAAGRVRLISALRRSTAMCADSDIVLFRQ